MPRQTSTPPEITMHQHDTNETDGRQGSVLEMALAYHRRGWSIIPTAPGKKKPPDRFRWKRYQKKPPSEASVRRWFKNDNRRGVAVIFGPVSGNLVCRDFDTAESYKEWAAAYPDLAATLPTVQTARGYHVYFESPVTEFHDFTDGEYRGNSLHYCVLPPSQHPDGPVYRWLIPLPDGPMPLIEDPRAAGLLPTPCATERTEFTERTESTEVYGDNRVVRGCERVEESSPSLPPPPPSSSFSLSSDVAQIIEQLIEENLPKRKGQRNTYALEFGRALKAVPGLADADAESLLPYVRHWHKIGVERGLIGTDIVEVTLDDFKRAWPKILFPKGANPMVQIIERAKAAPLPPDADKYESKPMKRLVAVCYQLQEASGNKPFFLACRTAGKALNVHYGTASIMLRLLVEGQTLRIVAKGGQQILENGKAVPGRATRYRYVGD